ncbi:hypothetical protein F2A37_02800 [Pseudomonas chlororaphis]|nr:hypothetical protein F2A37_02800 [Pseudomonas chlororaphis]KAB0527057.1 hypothetical protein F7R16_25820 [Pseudomonas chlororaphis subsp. aureofaciens]TSD30541.1 hypothetical protein FCE86_013470 [Pseudomonas sp. ATCC 13985]
MARACFCRSEACPRWRPCWRCIFWTVYISVPAVTAAGGFALTASHFFSNAKKSNQKTLAPAYGLRCAQVPSLRCPSGGIDSGRLRFDLHTMSSTASRGAARHPPDEHLRSASRWGGWIKSQIKSPARPAGRRETL